MHKIIFVLLGEDFSKIYIEVKVSKKQLFLVNSRGGEPFKQGGGAEIILKTLASACRVRCNDHNFKFRTVAIEL